ncbi:hypothetical protein [Solidesulfovibrio sp.]
MLRSLAVAASLSLTLLGMGCAGSGPKADNVPQAAVDADYTDCESRALVSTALITSAGEAEERQQQILDECMQEKGYAVK